MKVSVLTICRNDLEGLRDTVASVASQTRRPDEHIVLDGGSRDGTVEFLQGCPSVTAWKSEPDEGIADAFNKVVEMATGEWILFLNAGDEFADSKVLEEMVGHLETAPLTVGVCFGDAIVVDPAGLAQDRRLSGSVDLGHGTNPICHQATFLRRELQLSCRYDTRMRIGMDYDLWQRLAKRMQFSHVDRVVCRYRLGGISSTSAWGEHGIIMHHIVDWINGKERLGIAEILRLLRCVLVYRIKKHTEKWIGISLYARLKRLAKQMR